MASALAHRTYLFHPAQARHVIRRKFSQSVPALKRRGATSSSGTAFADDAFGAPADEDDLFPSSSGSSSSVPRSTSAFNKPLAQKKTQTAKSPFVHFDEQHMFVTERLGPRPAAMHPQVRQSALRRLLHHAQGPEHLDRVAEVLVKWRSDGRVVDVKTTREVIDRCIAWSPALLLALLADKAKYGLTIPGMADVRRILHRLVFFRPHPISQSSNPEERKAANAEALRNAVTFAALLPAHGLKRATDDLICCALLAQACARNLTLAPSPSSQEGDAAQEPAPATRRAQLGSASTRGLLSISTSLASLLSQPSSSSSVRALPSPEYATHLVEVRKAEPYQYKYIYLSGEERVTFTPPSKEEWKELKYTVECARIDPIVFRKRTSGLTQTGLAERTWVIAAVQDVVRALKSVENTNRSSLAVLEKVLGNALGKDDAKKVEGSITWKLPNPYRRTHS